MVGSSELQIPDQVKFPKLCLVFEALFLISKNHTMMVNKKLRLFSLEAAARRLGGPMDDQPGKTGASTPAQWPQQARSTEKVLQEASAAEHTLLAWRLAPSPPPAITMSSNHAFVPNSGVHQPMACQLSPSEAARRGSKAALLGHGAPSEQA